VNISTQVMPGSTASLTDNKDLFRCSFQISHGSRERVWNIPDMPEDGDRIVFSMKTCIPFPKF